MEKVENTKKKSLFIHKLWYNASHMNIFIWGSSLWGKISFSHAEYDHVIHGDDLRDHLVSDHSIPLHVKELLLPKYYPYLLSGKSWDNIFDDHNYSPQRFLSQESDEWSFLFQHKVSPLLSPDSSLRIFEGTQISPESLQRLREMRIPFRAVFLVKTKRDAFMWLLDEDGISTRLNKVSPRNRQAYIDLQLAYGEDIAKRAHTQGFPVLETTGDPRKWMLEARNILS